MRKVIRELKTLFKKFLRLFGLEIKYSGWKNKYSRNSILGALENMKKLGFTSASVLDVGAAFGHWSLECSNIFPDSDYFLIEPLKEYNHSLEKVKNKIKKCRYFNFAATVLDAPVIIYVHKDFVGSSLKKELEEYNQKNSQKKMINGVRLDTFCKNEGVVPPYLIKIDVQGSELDVLNGALDILKHAEAIILEVSLIASFENGISLKEVVGFMNEKGFAVYDIVGFSYRPYDLSLSQIDIIFVKEDSKLREFKDFATKEQRDKQDERFINLMKKNQ